MYNIKKLATCSLARRVFSGGTSPQQLATAVCLAAAVGVMPCPWGATALCALLATRLRLNQALVQVINYCCFPLQMALFIPFCHLGALILPWEAEVTAEMLAGLFDADMGPSLELAVEVVISALWGWLMTIPLLALMLFPLLNWIFTSGAVSRRLHRFKVKESEAQLQEPNT